MINKIKPLENKITLYLTIVSITLSKIEDKDGNSVEQKEDAWWQWWDFNRVFKMVVECILKIIHSSGENNINNSLEREGSLVKLAVSRVIIAYVGDNMKYAFQN